MSFSPALVYDFIFLAVFSFAAVKSWQKGFLAGLTELIGAVLGVGIASWGSRTLAPEVYLSFFSDSVSTRVEQAVAQSGGDIAAAVQGLDFLPESIRPAGGRCQPAAVSGTGSCDRRVRLLAAGAAALVRRQHHHRPDRLADHRRFAAQRRVQPFWCVQPVFAPLLNKF